MRNQVIGCPFCQHTILLKVWGL